MPRAPQCWDIFSLFSPAARGILRALGASPPFYKSGGTPASPWGMVCRQRGAKPWYPSWLDESFFFLQVVWTPILGGGRRVPPSRGGRSPSLRLPRASALPGDMRAPLPRAGSMDSGLAPSGPRAPSPTEGAEGSRSCSALTSRTMPEFKAVRLLEGWLAEQAVEMERLHDEMRSLVDSTLAFERFMTNEQISGNGMTDIMNGDERNPE
ncbi:hypothetical protein Taro_031464 [Colocasia esculenta]|uniref:Uncharacterized protein n=1 Tax=Colocasia esculenta TaxID=4460 RepID=A0A843VS04_COLES|nr:hypothetical protein [Colocasia esculenta]